MSFKSRFAANELRLSTFIQAIADDYRGNIKALIQDNRREFFTSVQTYFESEGKNLYHTTLLQRVNEVKSFTF